MVNAQQRMQKENQNTTKQPDPAMGFAAVRVFLYLTPVLPIEMSIKQCPKHLTKTAIINSKDNDNAVQTRHECTTA